MLCIGSVHLDLGSWGNLVRLVVGIRMLPGDLMIGSLSTHIKTLQIEHVSLLVDVVSEAQSKRKLTSNLKLVTPPKTNTVNGLCQNVSVSFANRSHVRRSWTRWKGLLQEVSTSPRS